MDFHNFLFDWGKQQALRILLEILYWEVLEEEILHWANQDIHSNSYFQTFSEQRGNLNSLIKWLVIFNLNMGKTLHSYLKIVLASDWIKVIWNL